MKREMTKEFNPQEILNTGQKRLFWIQFIKAAFTDIFLLFYSVEVVWRIIWLRFWLQIQEAAFSWNTTGVVFFVCILTGTLWTYTRTSIGSRLFGISRPGRALKINTELFGWFLFNITFIAGWVITKISIIDLFSHDGIQGANRIFGALFKPELGIFDDALFAIIETIYIALLATVLSIPPSLILSFLTARNLMKDSKIAFAVYYALRFILNFIRSIEPLIWAIVFSVWVGIGPYAGMIALLVHTVASNAKLFSEAIEGIDEGPVEAITAVGANKIQVVWYAVIPQVTLPFLSFTIYRWDINVRMATVIGLVGGGGIGTMLIQYQGLAKWNEVGMIVILVAIVVWIMDYLSAKVRESIK